MTPSGSTKLALHEKVHEEEDVDNILCKTKAEYTSHVIYKTNERASASYSSFFFLKKKGIKR